MGGQEVQCGEQFVIVLKMLTPDTPASMVIVLEDYSDFDARRAKLEKQVDWLLDHPVSGNPRVHLVDGQDEEQQPPHTGNCSERTAQSLILDGATADCTQESMVSIIV